MSEVDDSTNRSCPAASSVELNIRVDEDQGIWNLRNKRIEKLKMGSEQSTLTQLPALAYLDLHKAVVQGNVDHFIDLLDQLASAKEEPSSLHSLVVGTSQNSLLHVAVCSGSQEIAKLLACNFPWLISKQDVIGNTALQVAAAAGKLEIVETLASYAKNTTTELPLLRIKNAHGNTALHEAVINSHNYVAQFLISEDPEVWYYQNKQDWSPLYAAAKLGNIQILQLLLQPLASQSHSLERLEGNSPAHAAIIIRSIEMLEKMAETNEGLVYLLDKKGRTPLHWAAYLGNLDAVSFLLKLSRPSLFEMDSKGFFPIHIAAEMGRVKVLEMLLEMCPDPRKLLNRDGQNILHVAAKFGRHKVVTFLLETHACGGGDNNFYNEKDKNGDTPLHLAAKYLHPRVVGTLTWDKRINLCLMNNESLTALDALRQSAKKLINQKEADFLLWRRNLTAIMLVSSNTPSSLYPKVRSQTGQGIEELDRPLVYWARDSLLEEKRKREDTALLIGTLVATVTFAAAFTVPGGYNSSDSNPRDNGLAVLNDKFMFQLFVVCNTASFYAAVIGVAIVLWSRGSDVYVKVTGLHIATLLLHVAFLMMSLAFMGALHVTVSKVSWLASFIVIVGIPCLAVAFILSLMWYFRFDSTRPLIRYISYYVFLALLPLGGRYPSNVAIDSPIKTENESNKKED